MDLGALEELPLTYSEVGATAAGQLPAGYGHLHTERQIGTGQQRFEQAADAVMRWGMQRGAGLRVRASSEVAEVAKRPKKRPGSRERSSITMGATRRLAGLV